MELKFETDKGWTEAIIVDDCDFERFYSVAEVLSNHLSYLKVKPLVLMKLIGTLITMDVNFVYIIIFI